jgi:SAM-dependent methyltransferase
LMRWLAMEAAKAMNCRELHLHLLRILYQVEKAISPKELIERYASNYLLAYTPAYAAGMEYGVTDAKIYAAIKFLEKEHLIERAVQIAPISPRRPPRLRISELGKQVIKQTMSLSIQNLLSFFVVTFFREKNQQLRQLGLIEEANLGLIMPGSTLGQTVLSLFAQSANSQAQEETRTSIYYIDFDALLSTRRKQGVVSKKDPAQNVASSFNRNIQFRSCSLVQDKTLRIDVGANQLDFIISLMLLSNFPEDCEGTLREICRILKPGGVLVLLELNLTNSVIMWLLQRFTPDEIHVLPDAFFNIARLAKANESPDMTDLTSKIRDVFGEIIELEEFTEIQLIYARKSG